jgi:hypothetical protein
MALPLYVTLGYLTESLHARIPLTVLARLGDAARVAGALEREVAMRGALAAAPGGFIGFLRNITDWRQRLRFVCWTLFPSPSYLSSVEHMGCHWLLPFHYIYRPLRSVIRTLWFLSKYHLRRLWKNLMTIRAVS